MKVQTIMRQTHNTTALISLTIITIGIGLLAGAPATGHAQTRAGGGLLLTSGGGSSNAAVYGEVAGGMSDTVAIVGRIGAASSVTVAGGPRFYTGRDEMRPYGQFLLGYTSFDGGGGAASYSPGGGVLYGVNDTMAIQAGGEIQHRAGQRQDADGVHLDGGRVARAGELAPGGRPGSWETPRGPKRSSGSPPKEHLGSEGLRAGLGGATQQSDRENTPTSR